MLRGSLWYVLLYIQYSTWTGWLAELIAWNRNLPISHNNRYPSPHVCISLRIDCLAFIDYRSSTEEYVRSRQRLLLILFTIILFIINTADFVNTPGQIFVESREALMMTLSGGIAQQSEVAENMLNRWQVINAWPTTIEVLISYLSLHNAPFNCSIVVYQWCACSMESHCCMDWKWMGKMGTNCSCSGWHWFAASNILMLKCLMTLPGVNFAGGVITNILPPSSPVQTKTNVASIAVSFGTNLFATALVGLKFW